MTEEQTERYLSILEKQNQALENISYSIDGVQDILSNAFTSSNSGEKYLLGISQALFMAVGCDPFDGSINKRNGINIQK